MLRTLLEFIAFEGCMSICLINSTIASDVYGNAVFTLFVDNIARFALYKQSWGCIVA